ncbi:uncharacterized protein LOC122403740 isoform X2 [Colletes gigas]|uniref:uncharacterized protein LOC122403740 isoform X2 n=1 Tax=Colletes gigas TaxID=935657 RepID=UPI001C9B7BBD|nr:uncharacterized protein LOC122403740 isoform X2 [Colletes gigas]
MRVYTVTDLDILEINDQVSTIFCSKHTLQMNRTFNAFQMSQKPERTSYRKHTRLTKSMTLPDDTLEYWRFYLLEGSSVVLSVCSRFEGASILLVKGEHNLRTCGLLEHDNNEQMIEGIYLPEAKRQVKVIFKSDTKENGKLNNTEEKLMENLVEDSNVDITDKIYKESVRNENVQGKTVYGTRKLNNAKKKLTERRRRELNIGKQLDAKELQRKLNLKRADKMVGRKIRSQELIRPPFLLDQGIKHGGNAIKNETDVDNDSVVSSFENELLKCYGGSVLIAQEFAPSEQCNNIDYFINGKHMETIQTIVESGYYYYIFYSDNDIVSNDIYAIFDIYKPVFQYENVTKSCTNQTKCSFPIDLLSSNRLIVEIPTIEGDEIRIDDADLLLSICHPRMEVYIFFPIAVLFCILTCAFM